MRLSYLCSLYDNQFGVQCHEEASKESKTPVQSFKKRGAIRSEVAEINWIQAWSCESPHSAEERQ